MKKIGAFIGCFEKGFAILFVKIALKFIPSLMRTKNGRFVGFAEKIIINFSKNFMQALLAINTPTLRKANVPDFKKISRKNFGYT